MFKCTSCKKFASLSPGKCWKCGATLEDSSPLTLSLKRSEPKLSWKPKASIDDKKKTGDQEQLGMIWVAHQCINSKAPRGEDEDEDEAHDEPLEMGSQAFEEARKEFVNSVLEYDSSDVSSQLSLVRPLVTRINAVLGFNYRQFIVNLAMFDFRTAGGGRARKVSTWVRASQYGGMDTDVYVRPFQEPVPHGIEQLLSVTLANALAFGPTETVSTQGWVSAASRYIPPSRFTATFPLALTNSADNPPALVSPQVPSGSVPHDDRIKFAYMGSFGFSEPSYTTWPNSGDNEYAGTRLSLGAYSLNTDYLNHLLRVMRQVLDRRISSESEHRKGYLGYGGAQLTHVEALLKVARKSGHKLALQWARQMVEVARALVSAAEEKVRASAQEGLAAFFVYVRAKIERREKKLRILEDEPESLTCFEYAWVMESSLWELAFLGASCLTMDELRDALAGIPELQARWKPSVGSSESSISEIVRGIPSGGFPGTFHRIYAPNGTAAALALNEALLELNYAVQVVTPDRERLHPFVPYFEFYMGGFLSSNSVTVPQGTQVWVNLSESLHSNLREFGILHKEAGTRIAEMLMEYMTQLGVDDSQAVILVIDFTKFSGEMPNSILYPILAQLARTLIGKEAAAQVVFLRSNLKYNTGPLDRYQSGELLFYSGYDGAPANIITRVTTKAQHTFLNGMDRHFPDAKKWSLRGEYISLMKKVYLLADAIGSWRWAGYASEW